MSGTGAESASWVGRAIPRLEDDSLLRGAGRYIDDLSAPPGTCDAAILRSQYAHARVVRLDTTAALDLPGVVGVLTGADVASMSRPFPAGVESPIPYRAAAHEVERTDPDAHTNANANADPHANTGALYHPALCAARSHQLEHQHQHR